MQVCAVSAYSVYTGRIAALTAIWWVMVRFRVSFCIGVMIVLEDGGGAKEPGSYFRNFVCA